VSYQHSLVKQEALWQLLPRLGAAKRQGLRNFAWQRTNQSVVSLFHALLENVCTTPLFSEVLNHFQACSA